MYTRKASIEIDIRAIHVHISILSQPEGRELPVVDEVAAMSNESFSLSPDGSGDASYRFSKGAIPV